MSFANQLKTARGNLTQDAAANIISIAKRTYCDWEAGKVVPHRYMQDGSLRDLRATKTKKAQTRARKESNMGDSIEYCQDCETAVGCHLNRGCLAKKKRNARRSAADCSDGWLPIDSAPQDGTEIIVYCPPAHGLNHMASVCAWHEDTGFCVDELREPSLWIPLPNVPAMAYADTQTPPKKTTP